MNSQIQFTYYLLAEIIVHYEVQSAAAQPFGWFLSSSILISQLEQLLVISKVELHAFFNLLQSENN